MATKYDINPTKRDSYVILVLALFADADHLRDVRECLFRYHRDFVDYQVLDVSPGLLQLFDRLS